MYGSKVWGVVCLMVMGLCACACAQQSVSYERLTDASYVAGPKITAESLKGKTVLLIHWSTALTATKDVLPEIASVCDALERRGTLVLLFSHSLPRGYETERDDAKVRDIIKSLKIKNAVYHDVFVEGLNKPAFLPYAVAISRTGKLLKAGDVNEVVSVATQEALNAPDAVAGSLVEGVELNEYQSLKKRLVFGNNVESLLRNVARASDKKLTEPKNKEARAILKAVDEARAAYDEKIKKVRDQSPALALTLMEGYMKTWPSHAALYKTDAATLAKNPQVKQLQKFRGELESLEKMMQKSADGGAGAARATKARSKSYASLASSKDSSVVAEYTALVAELDALCGRAE